MDRLTYRDDTGRALLTLYGKQMYCSTQATADCFAKLEESIPRWIPVTERLPERPEYYPHCEIRKCYFLVALESGAVMSKFYDFDKNRWETPTYSPVTHWMPLPEPPEEGGGEDGNP